jgi:hypothetical protein
MRDEGSEWREGRVQTFGEREEEKQSEDGIRRLIVGRYVGVRR